MQTRQLEAFGPLAQRTHAAFKSIGPRKHPGANSTPKDPQAWPERLARDGKGGGEAVQKKRFWFPTLLAAYIASAGVLDETGKLDGQNLEWEIGKWHSVMRTIQVAQIQCLVIVSLQAERL